MKGRFGGTNLIALLNDKFELIEDEIDIDNIEEIKWRESEKEHLGYGVLVANDKINELVQAVKQLGKRVKELEELNIEINEKDINEAINKAREQRNKEIKSIKEK